MKNLKISLNSNKNFILNNGELIECVDNIDDLINTTLDGLNVDIYDIDTDDNTSIPLYKLDLHGLKECMFNVNHLIQRTQHHVVLNLFINENILNDNLNTRVPVFVLRRNNKFLDNSIVDILGKYLKSEFNSSLYLAIRDFDMELRGFDKIGSFYIKKF